MWQPWPALMMQRAGRAKRYETRSWYTEYRGPLVLCSTKTTPPDIKAFVEHGSPFKAALDGQPWREELGMALLIVNLKDCIEMTGEFIRKVTIERGGNEIYFGLWTPGRYAWDCADVIDLPKPFARSEAGRDSSTFPIS
jgi:hypothetical protein